MIDREGMRVKDKEGERVLSKERKNESDTHKIANSSKLKKFDV